MRFFVVDEAAAAAMVVNVSLGELNPWEGMHAPEVEELQTRMRRLATLLADAGTCAAPTRSEHDTDQDTSATAPTPSTLSPPTGVHTVPPPVAAPSVPATPPSAWALHSNEVRRLMLETPTGTADDDTAATAAAAKVAAAANPETCTPAECDRIPSAQRLCFRHAQQFHCVDAAAIDAAGPQALSLQH